MAQCRVLLVDDDPSILRTFNRILTKSDFMVDIHESGFGLAVRIKKFEPDIIVLDINMPGLSGPSAVIAALELCSLAQRPRLLVVSGMHELDIAEAAHEVGADAWLTKPVPIQHLVECVRRLESDCRGNDSHVA